MLLPGSLLALWWLLLRLFRLRWLQLLRLQLPQQWHCLRLLWLPFALQHL